MAYVVGCMLSTKYQGLAPAESRAMLSMGVVFKRIPEKKGKSKAKLVPLPIFSQNWVLFLFNTDDWGQEKSNVPVDFARPLNKNKRTIQRILSYN